MHTVASTLDGPGEAEDDVQADMSAPKPKRGDSTNMSESLTCTICQGLFHQPVTLWDCTHSFCGGCLAAWLGRSNDCPLCRKTIEAIRPNYLVKV